MKTIKNSCNGKGCSIRVITLPNDSRAKPVLSKVYGARNDIQKILPIPCLLLGKVA